MTKKKPLLVALHTWSGSYRQPEPDYARWCIQNGWCFIHPHFRGPNWTPQALGSELVVQDIVSAVQFALKTYGIDQDQIYLIGVSGGAHAALLMAGRRPDIWAGVSAWCGICDLRQWWKERGPKNRYSQNIEAACGGCPEIDGRAAEECVKRSPAAYLANARTVNLDINAGVKDGRSGSVPFTHSLRAFNIVAQENDKICESDIEWFYKEMKAPSRLLGEVFDPLYGRQKPLFRKISKNVRVTIFDGGHEIIPAAALNWLAQQRKGSPPVWEIKSPVNFESLEEITKSGL
ncbi:MAG: prolyl oligopeptidase family serine peptidase [Kiritimatiellae bacterium]|nr:prolyl oligopeptidase family serine peptidase [Kiritimatiellia bacterium]